MRNTKKASIALTLGFALSIPQIAFAQAVNCATTSHPSCQSADAPQAKAPQANKKSGKLSFDAQIRAVERKIKAIDKKRAQNRAKIEKLEKRLEALRQSIAKRERKLMAPREGQIIQPIALSNGVDEARAAYEAAAAEAARLKQEAQALRAEADALNQRKDSLIPEQVNGSEDQAVVGGNEVTTEAKEAAITVLPEAPVADVQEQEVEKTEIKIERTERKEVEVKEVREEVRQETREESSPAPAAVEPTSARAKDKDQKKPLVAQFEGKDRTSSAAPSRRAKMYETSELPSGADMSVEALQASLRGFHWEASRDGSKISFDGKIFHDCEDSFGKLKIAQVRSQDGYKVGIRVRDAGQAFAKCMEKHANQVCDATDDKADACVAVSEHLLEYPSTSPAEGLRDIALQKDATKGTEIGIFVAKADSQPTSENIDFTTEFKGVVQNGKSTYTSPQIQARLEREAAVKKEEEEYSAQLKSIEDLSCTVSDCFQKGDYETARDVCGELGRLRNQGGLDGDLYALASKHFMGCASEISSRDQEEKIKALLTEFDDATEPALVLKKANLLVTLANSKKEYAATIAEKFLGKIQALGQGSLNTPALPSLPGLTQAQPGVPSLGGQQGQNASLINARREADALEKGYGAAKELAKLGIKLKAGKDWDALFSQQLAAVDFQSCEARASIVGIMDAKVSKCIQNNYKTAQLMYKKDCGKDQSSDACMNAVMMYQAVQSSYANGLQKSQMIAMGQTGQPGQQQVQNMNNLMGNGNSFMGLNNYSNANTLPGNLFAVNPGSSSMSGLTNLGNRNVGLNGAIAGSPAMLSGVQFF